MLSSLLWRQVITTALLGVQVVPSVVTKGDNFAACTEVAGTIIGLLAAAICLVSAKPLIQRIVAAR